MYRIQFLNGGLANQAFQYIFARYYELSHPGGVMYMDDSYFALNTVHNGYELEKVFGIRPHMFSEIFDQNMWQYILSERKAGKSIPQILLDNGNRIAMFSEVSNYAEFNPFQGQVWYTNETGYDPDILDYPGNVYYHGYWICKEWFDKYKEIFLKEFTFPQLQDDYNKRLMNDIMERDSLSIHIRRGDFVQLNWNLSIQQYREGVNAWINDLGKGNEWDLYVFSDDINWCKANREELGLDAFRSVCFVEGNMGGKNYIDLQLMSQCKGMICYNSSFSYLAALLNTRKVAYIGQKGREV
ncbi:MAG: alpha-1,2-fucosyltransferase [Lachnospiraceae bacterium]|nr:alpha-1,2-fucosyltransferase [Lachnospiraceae bacterium]